VQWVSVQLRYRKAEATQSVSFRKKHKKMRSCSNALSIEQRKADHYNSVETSAKRKVIYISNILRTKNHFVHSETS